MYREYLQKEKLTEEDLINDQEFLLDASTFLGQRTSFGKDRVMSDKEVYDQFMEHFRLGNAGNEITLLRDYDYAQKADLEGKLRMANLVEAFDKVDEGISLRMMGDYAEGLATAPSTYLGMLTAGTGKMASVAGAQATKLGIRKILSEATKSAAKAAAVEGSIGLGAGALREATDVEIGLEEEFTGGETVATGLTSAVTGGLINFPIGAIQAKRASKANEILAQARLAQSKRATEASEASDSVLSTEGKSAAEKAKIEKESSRVIESLKALDPDKVAQGRAIKNAASDSDTLIAGIPSETLRNITAAAIRIKDRINVEPGERITSALSRSISKNDLAEIDDIQKILEEHNLSMDEFSLLFLAEYSEAGRILQTASQTRKAFGGKIGAKEVKENLTQKVLDDVDKLNKAGMSSVTKEELETLGLSGNFVRDLDKLRLGLMTSQPATTLRNTFGGGLRVAVDASERTFDNIIAKVTGKQPRNIFDGTFDVAKFMINPYEAKVVETLFRDAFPKQAAKLFREAADINAKYSEGPLATIGRKVNVFNTISDNFFKRAVLSAALKRRLSDAGEDFYDVIKKGDMKNISPDLVNKAMDDAYEFVYQKNITRETTLGRIGNSVISAHQDLPFIVSSFLPFPRFVASQLKFQFDHAPIIGLLPLENLGRKEKIPYAELLRDKLPKQLTGAGMLMAAYAWRAQQGETTYWYEYKSSDGKLVDGRALYGPMAPYILLADVVFRYQNDQLPSSPSRYMRDIAQATLGSTFRTGLGLYTLDKLWDDAANGKALKPIAEGLGNIIQTFTIPAQVPRDVLATIDADYSGIPMSRTGETNFFDILYRRATGSLPRNFANETDFFGYENVKARSPFQTGELNPNTPLERQILAQTRRDTNVILDELRRLNVQPSDLYRKDRDDLTERYIVEELSREGGPLNLERQLNRLLANNVEYRKNTFYRDLSDEEKILAIKSVVDIMKSKAKEIASVKIVRDAEAAGTNYTTADINKWESTNRIIKRAVDRRYKDEFGGDSILADKDKMITLEDGTQANVLQWALRTAEVLGKK